MPETLKLPDFGARQNIRERVAEALRAAVVAGQMRPGEVYSAPALAEQLGVSATPVREAMLDLAKEGLITTVRNKGFRVTAISEQDLDEITEIRALIEGPTAAKVARTVAPERILGLRPLAEAIVAAAENRDVVAYIAADQAFHLGLLGLAGNPLLLAVVRDLRRRSRLYGVARLAQTGELTASAGEHLAILDAAARGDGEAVAGLMRHHLSHVRGTWAGQPAY